MTDSINTSDFYTQINIWFFQTSKTHGECRQWMKKNENIQKIMQEFQCTKDEAKRFLGLMYIYREQNHILEDNLSLDAVLKRLCRNLAQKIQNRDDIESIYHASVRAKPIFNAWKARDKTTLLRYLEDEAIRANGESRDEMFEYIRIIGGNSVLERVEERCNRLSVINVNELEETIAKTVERAFWDSTRAKIIEGDIEPLYDVLRNAQTCVQTLLAAAPKTRDQFNDRFNVDWIKERAENNSLTRTDVGNLCIYLAEQVGRMQAPADDEVVQPWVQAVRLRAEESDELKDYLPDVVFVVRDAIDYLRLVYKRVVQQHK